MRWPIPCFAALTLFAASAQAIPGDYSQVERCLSPTGPNPTYLKWIGSADSSLSFISQTQVNLALEVGKDRQAPGPRTVNIYKLKRVGDLGLLEPSPMERDDFFPDVLELTLTNEADSYLLEFVPAQPGVKESCVLAFGNAWAWMARPGAKLPWQPRQESFTADRLSITVLKQTLYKGQDGPPQRLRLEPLKDHAPALAPIAILDAEPGFAIDWDGKGNALRNVSNTTMYNLWLCSAGPSLVPHPTCLGLVQFRLNDDPLIIRARSEAGVLKQTASIRSLDQGQLTTYALLGNAAGSSARTFEYGGSPESAVLPPGVRDNFVKSERDLEYVVVLAGSADSERMGRRCPADLSQPMSQLHVFAGGSSSAVDVNACLFVRDNTKRQWQLVPDAPDGDAPEQRLLDALQFSICPPASACIPATSLGARTQLGFRLNARSSTLTLQATSVHDSPMPLEPATVSLATVGVTYLPRLPAAALTETEIGHIAFKTFEPGEWEAGKKPTCIQGDWKRQYGSDVINAGATLLLRAGAKQTMIGDGRWRPATIDGSDLLCPELSEAQLQPLLSMARDALLAGDVAELDAVQGGQFVGHHVVLQGPPRVPIVAFELRAPTDQGGGMLDSFTLRNPLPDIGSVCALTAADWGPTIFLDASRLSLESDLGEIIGVFRSMAPRPERHPFERPTATPKTPDGKLWRYCAPVGGEPPAAGALALTDEHVPELGTAEVSLILDDAQGCGDATSQRQACATLLAQSTLTATGRSALGAFRFGLWWGHEFSTGSAVPPDEIRVYVGLPVVLFEFRPGWVSIATEAGVQFGYATGRAVINSEFTTRAGVPIGAYGSLCFSLTALRQYTHASPQLCGGVAIDAFAIRSIASTTSPDGSIGVDGPAFVPFVSVGLGEF